MENNLANNNQLASVGGFSRKHHLLVLSAQGQAALRAFSDALAADLSLHPMEMADLEYTFLSSRLRFPVGRHIIFDGIERLREQLREPVDEAVPVLHARQSGAVFLFPGGGAQHVNMARGLYYSEAYFKQVVDEGLRYAEEMDQGRDFFSILYPEGNRSVSEIADPQVALPLLFIVEYAMARLLIHFGITPVAMIGHSLGEYTAACIAGVFSYADGVRIVSTRGRLMKKVEPGLMLSVAAPVEKVKPFLNEQVSVGAINSPSHCMLSGQAMHIMELKSQLERHTIQAKLIHIAVASHSHLMEPILGEFREVLQSITLRQPDKLFISNLHGQWSSQYSFDSEYWVRHLRQPVLFSDGISRILQSYPSCTFVEIAPGHTLSNLVTAHGNEGHEIRTVNVLRHPMNEADDEVFFLNALGELWSYGFDLDTCNFFYGCERKPVTMPSFSRLERGRSVAEDGMPDVSEAPDALAEKFRNILQARLGHTVALHDALLNFRLDEGDFAEINRQLGGDLHLDISRVLLLQYPSIAHLLHLSRSQYALGETAQDETQSRLLKAKDKIEKIRSVIRR